MSKTTKISEAVRLLLNLCFDGPAHKLQQNSIKQSFSYTVQRV
jgi:hypothetical protein